MGGNVVETLIGAAVIAVAAAFLVFAYSTAGVRSVGGYELVAKFDKVDGLSVGGDVRLSGIKVGTITSETLDPKSYQAIVRFTLAPNVQLPDDSSAKITSQGLLGGNYLALEPGGSDAFLKPGQSVQYTQGAVNLMDLIGRAIYSGTGSSKSEAAPAPAGNAPAAAPAAAQPASVQGTPAQPAPAQVAPSAAPAAPQPEPQQAPAAQPPK
ncbi:MAG TPA: outer membrane lipid asymmetry maintenance protein MlaD [Candidatus Cybelea sp.]|nr:outer membrane lipid asymmetry maintenance protein MlaD [Candidatus Cybelea sp.]